MLFEITKPTVNSAPDEMVYDSEEEVPVPKTGRFVRYQFTPQFLSLRTISATVKFTVGRKPLNKFRMIEQNYFRNRLLNTFDFGSQTVD